MNNKPTYISREGLEKLRQELEETVSIRRPEVAGRIHDAKYLETCKLVYVHDRAFGFHAHD